MLAGRKSIEHPPSVNATFRKIAEHMIPPERPLPSAAYPQGSSGAHPRAVVKIWTNAIVSPYAPTLTCAADQTTVIPVNPPIWCVDLFSFATDDGAPVRPHATALSQACNRCLEAFGLIEKNA